MRISDWSSDVCSSDLLVAQIPEQLVEHLKIKQRRWAMARSHVKADGKLARVRFHSAPICLKPVGECLRFCFRSEEHTSELQSLMRHSYAVFCLNTKNSHPLQQNNEELINYSSIN